MKVAIIGCGAMGSVYAARLSNAGHEIIGVHRGAAHVDAMNRAGLVVSGPDGEIHSPVRAFTTAPDEVVDIVVLAVKAADAAAAAEEARPLIGESTGVLTIQNGLGSAERVANALGSNRLAVGIASGFGASLRAPGRAHHNAMRAIRIGAYADLPAEHLETITSLFRSGGFDSEAVDDILAMQWEKLICNVAYSGPCAITGRTVGEVMNDPHLSRVSEAAAIEAWEIAHALEVAIGIDDPVGFVRDFGAPMPDAKPSTLLDIEAGRISEIEHINGAVPREARKIGQRAPVNETLTGLVRSREETRST